MSDNRLTLKKKIFFTLLTGVFILLITSVLGELLIRNFYPQVLLGPRWSYSEKYHIVWPKNRTIINEMPGKWKFIYTTNENYSRGKVIGLSNAYEKANIVVLGDSYSFGQGVNDNEEYASVLSHKLKDSFNVVNLSVSGWALTQEIRRYYELGQLYKPQLVILQFCENDPWGNTYFKVTGIENEKFVFKNSENSSGKWKRVLSDSFLQKSSLYALFTNLLRQSSFNKKSISNTVKETTNSNERDKKIKREVIYADLLDLFAKDLSASGIPLIMIAPNREMDNFPLIKRKVEELDSLSHLNYYETEDWFMNGIDYSSPEGHHWGTKGHAVIGERLSDIITSEF
ncbi:MAG: lysophospholipase L1-like esterase [Ancylomarina sp.]|jgi:lysophospholipase L1-like esterase